MSEAVYLVKMSISSLPLSPPMIGRTSLTGTCERALRRKSCWRAARTMSVSVWR